MATFFAAADDFAVWLDKHGAHHTEFVVGYYKRSSKRPSMTWAGSVDAALYFGWIDGVRNAAMSCDLEKPRLHENSSKRSRPATDTWSFGGSSVRNAPKPARVAWPP